jgi:hypothetical protein
MFDVPDTPGRCKTNGLAGGTGGGAGVTTATVLGVPFPGSHPATSKHKKIGTKHRMSV